MLAILLKNAICIGNSHEAKINSYGRGRVLWANKKISCKKLCRAFWLCKVWLIIRCNLELNYFSEMQCSIWLLTKAAIFSRIPQSPVSVKRWPICNQGKCVIERAKIEQQPDCGRRQSRTPLTVMGSAVRRTLIFKCRQSACPSISIKTPPRPILFLNADKRRAVHIFPSITSAMWKAKVFGFHDFKVS